MQYAHVFVNNERINDYNQMWVLINAWWPVWGLYSTYAQITIGVPQRTGQCFGSAIVFAGYKWCDRFVFDAVNVKLYADDIKICLEIVDDANIDQL